jgi:predicted Zn-dependent protease with MMP-like domain
MKDARAHPPSLADIHAIAMQALGAIPEPLRRFADGVVIRVEDFPDAQTEREMGLASPFDLLGLYRGVSLDRKSVADTPDDLDRVFLYRRPLLDYWCETGGDISHIVRHVLIHEIGHHFGLSDADMERIEENG